MLAMVLAVSACLSSANLTGGNDEAPSIVSGEAGAACTADLQADVGNCGACGKVCANQANAYGVCKAGACAVGCNTGFGDCDGKPETGCEAMLATDSNHCGACGKSCGGARCVAGQCQPLAFGEVPGYVSAVTQDATAIYYAFSAGGNYAIGRLAKSGATGHTEVVTGIVDGIASLAVTDTEVYWTRASVSPTAMPPDGAIRRASKTTPSVADAPWIGALALGYSDATVIADGSAFYAQSDRAASPLSTLSRAALTGTTSVVVAQGLKGTINTLGVDGGIAYYYASGDNTGVGRGLYRCPTSGCGSASVLVPGVPANSYLSLLSFNGPHVYFSTNRAVARMKKDGTEYGVLATTENNYGSVVAYAADTTRLYWIERMFGGGPGADVNSMFTCPIASCKDGRQQVLVSGAPRYVLVDDTAFYILAQTNTGAGTATTVLRVVK